MSGKISEAPFICIAPPPAARPPRAIGFTTGRRHRSRPGSRKLGAGHWFRVGHGIMSASNPASLTKEISAEERLALLRKGDRHRAWRSLDDPRVCVRCARAFSGDEVEFVTEAGGQLKRIAQPSIAIPRRCTGGFAAVSPARPAWRERANGRTKSISADFRSASPTSEVIGAGGIEPLFRGGRGD